MGRNSEWRTANNDVRAVRPRGAGPLSKDRPPPYSIRNAGRHPQFIALRQTPVFYNFQRSGCIWKKTTQTSCTIILLTVIDNATYAAPWTLTRNTPANPPRIAAAPKVGWPNDLSQNSSQLGLANPGGVLYGRQCRRFYLMMGRFKKDQPPNHRRILLYFPEKREV